MTTSVRICEHGRVTQAERSRFPRCHEPAFGESVFCIHHREEALLRLQQHVPVVRTRPWLMRPKGRVA